jgi:hypothetical protein
MVHGAIGCNGASSIVFPPIMPFPAKKQDLLMATKKIFGSELAARHRHPIRSITSMPNAQY